VHHHRLDADAGEQGEVAEDRIAQVVAHHGGTAVLDDDGLAMEALDVRQGLGKDLRFYRGDALFTNNGRYRKLPAILDMSCC
jgi:hypothetical protein